MHGGFCVEHDITAAWCGKIRDAWVSQAPRRFEFSFDGLSGLWPLDFRGVFGVFFSQASPCPDRSLSCHSADGSTRGRQRVTYYDQASFYEEPQEASICLYHILRQVAQLHHNLLAFPSRAGVLGPFGEGTRVMYT